MKRKLLFIIPSLKNGGAERVISILANEAVSRKYDVSVLLVLEKEVCYDLNKSIKIIHLTNVTNKNKAGVWVRRLLEMRSVIKHLEPDLIISFMTTMNLYAVLATEGLDISIVGSERNAPGMERKGHLRSLLIKVCYRMIDGMVFQTEEAKKVFQHIKLKSTAVIANPVSKDLPNWTGTHQSKKCVAVGRLEKQKNYPLLLEAFSLFHMVYPDYELEIYGAGSRQSELETIVAQKGLCDHVRFMGVHRNVHEMIKDAEMFVMTSDFEGIPNALLESLSMGIPSIATDCPCGGVRLLIEDEKNGYLVPVGDAKAISKRMCDVVENVEATKKMSHQAVLDMLQYSEKEICNQYFAYFEQVMSN